jgi:hypothetical protein
VVSWGFIHVLATQISYSSSSQVKTMVHKHWPLNVASPKGLNEMDKDDY